MKRGRGALTLAVVGLFAVAGWSSAAPQRDAIVNRSFTILAEAFPEAPVPGRGSTELGAKPLASRVAVSNAPPSAYGRSALSDNGTIELYTGPPPEGTVSECDTTSTNLPREADVDAAGARLTARCEERPAADVSASGAMSDAGGSGSSHASGDGGGDKASATSTATANDVTIGPVRIGSARYAAFAAADGTPGGATGVGRVEVSDATVNGVPVVIGPDGIAVDQSKVPTELVTGATSAVQKALGQGGYLNVRVAQPEVIAAEDGSSVLVRGGGVFFEGRSNDPTQPYFLRETLVGGSISISVGGDVSDEATPLAPPPTDVVSAPTERPQSARTVQSPDVVAAAPDPTPEVFVARSTYRTRPFGLGWLWIVIALGASAALAMAFRRRLEPWWDAVADRYLRG